MNINKAITSAVCRLLRPLVRILLRHNVPLSTFCELAKSVYVDVALEEFQIPGRKRSISRVALLTGLSRKEVLRVHRHVKPDDAGIIEQHNRAARIISGWVRDPRFADENGLPALLPFEGKGATFSELVRSFSGDIPPRAVLDEFIRVGAVERLSNGLVRLISHAYVPHAGKAELLNILGTDVSDLIATIDHNMQPEGGEPFFQRKVCYVSFPSAALPGLRSLTAEKAQAVLEELDSWMAERDREDTSTAAAEHRRTGIGIYYFEGGVEEDRHDKDVS